MATDISGVPEGFRRFLPAPAAEPSPAERFEGWLAAQPDDRRCRRARGPSPPGLWTWLAFLMPLGGLLAVIAALGWRIVG